MVLSEAELSSSHEEITSGCVTLPSDALVLWLCFHLRGRIDSSVCRAFPPVQVLNCVKLYKMKPFHSQAGVIFHTHTQNGEEKETECGRVR